MTTTAPIPGLNPGDEPGEVILRELHEITERYRRPLKTLMVQMNPARFQQIIGSDENTIEGLMAAPDLAFTQREADVFMSIGDHVVVAAVAGWSLDREVPRTADQVLDLPPHLYDALQEVTKEIGSALLGSPGVEVVQETADDGTVESVARDVFTVAAVEDPASPTGASDA